MRKVKKEEHIDSAKEFLLALDNIVKEKNIDKEGVLEAMEQGLASAYKKQTGKSNCKAFVNRETGEIKVYSFVTVVETVNDSETEISLEDAKKMNKTLEIGDTIDTEVIPKDFGRVATSTAKQVVVQKIREAERQVTLDSFIDKQDELLIGQVALEDTDNYYIDLGRSNGILPKKDIIPGEKIEMGSTIKVYVTKVDNSGRNLVIKLSRTHYGFVKRLFEHEIPEFSDGTLLMYGVARDPGNRSKVAVYTEKSNFEPIGACIGEKGSRIASIIKELHGEKVDVIKYDTDPKVFIENALAPAKNLTVLITDEKNREAIVVADDANFSLAIGKHGMNSRLASRLTRYKIDIKSQKEASEMGISIK